MHEVKDTARSLVRIGYDATVHKWFRGHLARERFENEIRVLKYLEEKGCDFVPKLISSESGDLKIVTTNCGKRVDHLDTQAMAALYDELTPYGVRHDDRELRNVTYRIGDGRFCLIDFELATILEFPPLQITWSSATDKGAVRENNEDSFLVIKSEGREVLKLSDVGNGLMIDSDYILAVSDGVGGARSGEIASKITTDKLNLLMPLGFRLRAAGINNGFSDILSEIFTKIHDELLRLGYSSEEYSGMGSTLSLCWLTPGWLYYGHIGDSRIYFLPENGNLMQLTEDHTLVGSMRKKGAITERDARVHPRRNVLNQILGTGYQILDPQVGAVGLKKGDKFMICSDGLVDGLWDHEIEALMRETDISLLAHALVDKAVTASGKDNVTAVAFEFTEDKSANL